MEGNAQGLENPYVQEAIKAQSKVDEPWHKRLVSRFIRSSEKDRQPNDPKLSFEVYLFEHQEAEDTREDVGKERFVTAKNMANKIAECDIFVPELIGWNDRYSIVYNRVSAGLLTPQEGYRLLMGRNVDYTIQATLQNLYQTKKPVAFIDIPRNDPMVKTIVEELQKIGSFTTHRYGEGGSLESRINTYYENYKRFAEITNKREEYMQDALKKAIERLYELNPALRNKPEVKVLLGMGIAHSTLAAKMKQDGQDVTRTFSQLPYTFNIATEIERRFAYGKEVTEDLVVKGILEAYIDGCFENTLTRNGYIGTKRSTFVRSIVDKLSKEDLADIVREDQQTGYKTLVGIMSRKLQEKGISIDGVIKTSPSVVPTR